MHDERCSARPGRQAQFNVYLPRPLVTRIKHLAVDENASLSALVEAALTEYADRKETS